MQALHNFIQYFVHLPTTTWWGLLSVLGTSAGMSIVLEMLKNPIVKRLEFHYAVQARKVSIWLLGFMSLTISAALDYVSSNGQSFGVVSGHAAWLMTGAICIYHFGGSQLYRNIRIFLQDLNVYLDTGKLPSDSPKS